jgi:hypothetical protein
MSSFNQAFLFKLGCLVSVPWLWEIFEAKLFTCSFQLLYIAYKLYNVCTCSINEILIKHFFLKYRCTVWLVFVLFCCSNRTHIKETQANDTYSWYCIYMYFPPRNLQSLRTTATWEVINRYASHSIIRLSFIHMYCNFFIVKTNMRA